MPTPDAPSRPPAPPAGRAEPDGPRVSPASRAELGRVNAVLVRIAGRVGGLTAPPNLFTTLGRHRGLFRRWLWFAGALMPFGKLPRADTELVILRVSHRCGCPYEADHHRPLARKEGLTEAQLEAVASDDLEAGGWTPRRLAILRAVDELHDTRAIGDDTFAALRAAGLGDRDLVELCLLAGHYEMLAGTINALGIQRDQHRSSRSSRPSPSSVAAPSSGSSGSDPSSRSSR